MNEEKGDLEELYHKFISDEIAINHMIDFIGINIDAITGDLDFKIYYAPIGFNSPISKRKHPIIEFNQKKEMVRCITEARDLNGLRSYVILKNRTDPNMNALFTELMNRYPHIRNNEHEIRSISQMKVTNEPNHKFGSLHILGFKSSNSLSDIVSVQWLTRKYPDTNHPGRQYKFNDAYFLDFVKAQRIRKFDILMDYAYKGWLNTLENPTLHLWLIAVDFYPCGKRKYKLYFKDESRKVNIPCSTLLESIGNTAISDRLKQLQTFTKAHKELNLYGFAICLDTDNKLTINYYFINN